MASQQEQLRRDNKTQERNMQVEKDIVPKRATQFEELASKATDSAVAAAASVDADRRNAGVRSTTVVMSVDQTGIGGAGAQQGMMRGSQTSSSGVVGAQQGMMKGSQTRSGGVGAQQGMTRVSQTSSSSGAVRGGTGVQQGSQTSSGVGAQQGTMRGSQTGSGVVGGGAGMRGSGNQGMDRSHFESLSDKVGGLEFGSGVEERGSSGGEKKSYEQAVRETSHGEAKHVQPVAQGQAWREKGGTQAQRVQTGPTSLGKFEMQGHSVGVNQGQHGADKSQTGPTSKMQAHYKHEQEKEKEAPSLEEITEYRQTAQQNSLDAIQAATERYSRAKEQAANAAWEAKEAAKHGLSAAAAKTSELGSVAKEKASAGVGATTQFISEKSRPVAETASEKAHQAKEAISNASQKTIDYTKETASQASEYTGEKAAQAKDTTVSTTKSVAGYVSEKAVAAGKTAVEYAGTAGKTAAEYAGKVAEEVKDQAVVAGWGAAHYTTEVAVEATKVAGGVLGKAKDVVATAAHKATELAEKPVVMARDVAVDTGEKFADYTARKKTEAEIYREQKHMDQGEGEGMPSSGGEKGRRATGTSGGGFTEKTQEGAENMKVRSDKMDEEGDIGEMVIEKGEGLLGTIGETIVEIAQHTTDLVAAAGPAPAPQPEDREIIDQRTQHQVREGSKDT